MAETFPSPEDPIATGAIAAKQMLDPTYAGDVLGFQGPIPIDAVEVPIPEVEADMDVDKLLAAKLREIGVTFPESRRPRGVVSSDKEVINLIGGNIVGSPLYVVSPEGNQEEVRLREMVHGFVQSNLVPDQPMPEIAWDEISETEVVALVQDVSRAGDLAKDLVNETKSILAEQSPGYERDPLPALRSFMNSIDADRVHEDAVRTLVRRRRMEWTRPNFEAVAASTNQRIIGALRERVYDRVGVERGIDLEEAVATYFACHALGTPPDAATELHQGERAAKYTLLLADRYPDPQLLAKTIELQGMVELLDSNADFFAESTPDLFTDETRERYAPLPTETIDARRNQVLDNYVAYEPITQALDTQLATNPNGLRSKALGGGRSMLAIPVSYAGHECIARIPVDPNKVPDITSRLEGSIRLLGESGFEQVLAASVKEGHFYSQELPGKVVRKLGYDEQREITDDQLSLLADRTMLAAGREVSLDTDQGNIFYDKDVGFSITDFSHTAGRKHSTVDALLEMGVSISAMGRGTWNRDTSATVKAEYFALSADLLRRFTNQCSTLLDDRQFAALELRMASHIKAYEAQTA